MILALLVLRLFDLPGVVNETFLLYVLTLVGCSSILFALRYEPNRAIRGQYLRISVFFLIGYVVVHFQVYLDYVLGNYRFFTHDYLISKENVPKASLASAIGLVSYYMGYMYMAYKRKKGWNNEIKQEFRIYPETGVFMLIIVTFLTMLATGDLRYFAGNYGTIPLGTVAGYAQEYLIYAIIGYILVKVQNRKVLQIRTNSFVKYIRLFPIHFLLILGVYLLLVIMSGDRGPILQILIAMLFGYVWLAGKKLKLPLFVGLIVVGSFAIALLGFVRALDAGQGDFMNRVSTAKFNLDKSSFSHSVSPATMELAVSVRTLHGAVRYSEREGHTYGIFQGFQLLGAIPGIGNIVKSLTGMDQDDLRSSGFITKELSGEKYDHGLGTTAVADIFLDFGVVGVSIGFFLFGCFVYYLEGNTFNQYVPTLFTLVLFFVFIAKSIYIGRSTIMVLFRESVLVFLVLMIGMFLSSFIFGRKVTKVD